MCVCSSFHHIKQPLCISLQAFADGSVAQAVLSKGKAGNFLSVPLAFGMAVTMGVYVSGGISGESQSLWPLSLKLDTAKQGLLKINIQHGA